MLSTFATLARPPYLRTGLVLLFASYLFVYPWGILLIALDLVPPWGTGMGGALLIAQGTLMLLWLALNYRWRGLLAALAILLGSWLIEHIGVTTGFPFGGYHYTDTLTPKVVGVVPLAVPFAWLLVIPAAIGITEHVLHRSSADQGRIASGRAAHLLQPTAPLPGTAPGPRPRLVELVRTLWADVAPPPADDSARPPASSAAPVRAAPALLGAMKVLGAASFALLLDLMIEPVAVDINGYWLWDNTGTGYYGVPGSNFAAWWITSLVLAWLLLVLVQRPRDRGRAGPDAAVEAISPPRLRYAWLPSTLYVLNLTMFVLVTLAHAKFIAAAIGFLLLVYLLIVWIEPRVVSWIMGEIGEMGEAGPGEVANATRINGPAASRKRD